MQEKVRAMRAFTYRERCEKNIGEGIDFQGRCTSSFLVSFSFFSVSFDFNNMGHVPTGSPKEWRRTVRGKAPTISPNKQTHKIGWDALKMLLMGARDLL